LIGFLVCWIRLFSGIRFDIQGVYQTLYEQLDFEKEAENMKEFRVMYREDLGVLKIPEVYYARENMIVMEYIPSVSREEESEWSYPERSEIYCLMKCWVLDQIIIKNCLHGDLHNGNWGITPDRQGIVLYDFGHVFKNMALTSDFYIAMLRKQHSDVADKMMALFGLEQTPELKTRVGEILERYRNRDQNSVSSEFIMDILKTLHQQKKNCRDVPITCRTSPYPSRAKKNMIFFYDDDMMI
jgi:predicted unusual protein kinase regulating ubiquinone biosynthesis (AarF/ABC1/UbiB family)